MKNPIALGTLQFSGWYRKFHDSEVIELIRTFIETGGSYIDTAPLYGFGKSDKLISKALQSYKRNRYVIISKCGFVNLDTCQNVEEAKMRHKNTSYTAILDDCEESLERLKTDYIDIYLLHTRDSKTPLEESLSALAFLRKKKKITYIGICNTTLEELHYIHKYEKIDYIQNRFSIINRSITNEFASYLLDNNISLMPYRVIDYGLLTDKSHTHDQLIFESFDARNQKPDLQKNKQEIILHWARDYLVPLSQSLGITVTQLSIAWTLKQPFVSIPIVGSTKKEYILENTLSDNITLSAASLRHIDKAYKKLESIIADTYKLPVHTFRGLNNNYY